MRVPRQPFPEILTQVTELRVIYENFGAGIERKSNAEGATTLEWRCSEDLVP